MNPSPSHERSRRSIALVWIALVAAHAPVAAGLPATEVRGPWPDDPVPLLDLGAEQRHVAVELTFTSWTSATVDAVTVAAGRARGRGAAPGQLQVTLFGLDGARLDQFDEWHPLTALGLPGMGGGVTLPLPAKGAVVFPLAPGAAALQLRDVSSSAVIAAVDLLPAVHDFCRRHGSDPACSSVADRAPTCDAGGPYRAECSGPRTRVTLDGTRSTDPDGDVLAFQWKGAFGSATGAVVDVALPGPGASRVRLAVSDGFGASATCATRATVVDTLPPVLRCNAPEILQRPRSPVSFTATALDACAGPLRARIVRFACLKEDRGPKERERRAPCKVAIRGDALVIEKVDAAVARIIWTVDAADPSGNLARQTCAVQVASHGHDRDRGEDRRGGSDRR